jgi:hypothetical protein
MKLELGVRKVYIIRLENGQSPGPIHPKPRLFFVGENWYALVVSWRIRS